MTSLVDRLRSNVGTRMLGNRKAVQDARFIPTFLKAAWTDIAFRVLAKEGYKANAAVYACVQAWAQAFSEPEMHVRRRDRGGASEWLWEHPARALIERPNAAMSEDEFWAFVITYLALGGNCYIWKERDRAGRPVALWPLHDGQVEPVPGARPGDGFVSHYLYDGGDGRPKSRVETTEVIQLRWAIDPLNPVRGLSPLVACSRSVDTANEAMRYQFALLKNDAVVSTLVSLKEPVGPTRLAELKRQFKAAFSGDNRGDAAFVEGADITISRLGSNLQELAIEALLNVPEANIAAAFEVPPGLAGLNVALQRPAGLGSVGDTAVQEFTQRRLVPRWRRVASQFTAGLLRDFDRAPGLALVFDTSTVQALREDEGALITTVNSAVAAGWMLVNEGRQRAGFQAVAGGNVFLRSFNVVEVPGVPVEGVAAGDDAKVKFTGVQIDKALLIVASVAAGTVARADGIAQLVVLLGMTDAEAAAIMGSTDAPPALPPPADTVTIDATTTGGAKAGAMPPFPLTVTASNLAMAVPSSKAAPKRATPADVKRAQAAARDVQERRAKLSKAARADAAKALDTVKARVVARVAAGGKALPLKASDTADLHDAVKGMATRAAESAFEHVGATLREVRPFHPDTPGIQAIFDRVGERIKGIDDTTRDKVQSYLDVAIENEWTPKELAKHIAADESGAFSAARAELIARTETGTVLNEAAVAGYRASGRVEKVIVFDGDDDGECQEANGQTWTLDKAEAEPLSHPRCVRSFAPVVDLGDE